MSHCPLSMSPQRLPKPRSVLGTFPHAIRINTLVPRVALEGGPGHTAASCKGLDRAQERLGRVGASGSRDGCVCGPQSLRCPQEETVPVPSRSNSPSTPSFSSPFSPTHPHPLTALAALTPFCGALLPCSGSQLAGLPSPGSAQTPLPLSQVPASRTRVCLAPFPGGPTQHRPTRG